MNGSVVIHPLARHMRIIFFEVFDVFHYGVVRALVLGAEVEIEIVDEDVVYF